ncbi:MAG TPA: hypothetical protein VD837_11590 [Terriglobales bacterium]|nr:hypothetical protein [Terriglobales bacterium]
MKIILSAVICLLAIVSPLGAQVIDTTVCDILANPQAFDGKTVRLKGVVTAGFDDFSIKDSNCKRPVNAIWLAFPEGTKAKAGPVAAVQIQLAKNSASSQVAPSRPPVKLDKNKDFKQFDSLLSAPYKGPGMCLGCGKYKVTATLTGRLDGTKDPGVVRDASGKVTGLNGFGNMRQYSTRLVLQSVTEVAGQEIDYSKSAAEANNDNKGESGGGDPVAAAHQAARALGQGSPAGIQVQQAAAAFGEPGESNGVVIDFGTPNEALTADESKGSSDSPDGLLFRCTFNMDRLKGDALARAISHTGTHIADFRRTGPVYMPYESEYRAWQTTILSALATGQKSLTAPGGVVIWNTAWSAETRNNLVHQALSDVITNWTSFQK